MIKRFFSFFFFKNKSLKCFFIGFRFTNCLLNFSNKKCFREIVGKLKYSLLRLFVSSSCFLCLPAQYQQTNPIGLRKILFIQKLTNWRLIKKLIIKQFNRWQTISYKKNKFGRILTSLWEIIGKFFSLLPIYFLKNPSYGENMVEYNQQNELDFSIYYLKAFVFKPSNLFVIIKRFRYDFFLRFFHISPEHGFSILGEDVYYTLFSILIKLFLSKPVNTIKKLSKPYIGNFNVLNIFRVITISSIIINQLPLNLDYVSFINKISKKNLRLIPHKSYKHLWGIFSLYFLEILTIVIEYRGPRIQKKFKNLIEKSNRNRKKTIFFFELNQTFTIDATFLGNQGRLINHDCKTNCFTRVLKHSYKNYVFIITKKKINRLEEMSYDYRMNIDDFDSDQIQCLCFNFDCKKELVI